MHARELLMLLLAGLFGFVGGIPSGRLQSAKAAAEPQIVRASRFELVDRSGRTVAALGRNQTGEVVLTFDGAGGRELAAFGLHHDRSPFLNLMGKDGKIRLTLSLGRADKPLLGMGDEREEGRVLLGFMEQDAPAGASSSWDDWGLLFRSPASLADLASIGLVADSKGVPSGRVAVRSATGRQWTAPQ